MGIAQDIETSLQRLSPVLVPGGQSIGELKRLSGGASQETWSFDVLAGPDTRTPLILRRAPGGQRAARSSAAIGLDREADLIRAAARAGVPVPSIAHVCGPDDGLGEAYVMERLAGETIAPKILRGEAFGHARKVLASQCGAALASIHSIRPDTLPELPLSQGLDQLDQYEEIYRNFDIPKPVFELAIAWLRAHTPTATQITLVHGDFRLGNLMVDDTGLVGILDWELAHLGDPREDIAWICINSWRFGVPEKRVGGFGELPEFLDAYARAGGTRFEPAEIDWWEMLGSLKWGVMCLIMYEAFRSGADPSVERAAIGRRVSETEIDLLNLLERV
jgi:aminoglycoside phosphotransferase (APT) family kinase protein